MIQPNRSDDETPTVSDASLNVKLLFAEIEDSLTGMDPQRLSKTSITAEPTAHEVMQSTIGNDEEDMPEVYHDNICDPADISAHQPKGKVEAVAQAEKEQRNTGTPMDGLKEIQNSKDDPSGLSEVFILEGHSYL